MAQKPSISRQLDKAGVAFDVGKVHGVGEIFTCDSMEIKNTVMF